MFAKDNENRLNYSSLSPSRGVSIASDVGSTDSCIGPNVTHLGSSGCRSTFLVKVAIFSWSKERKVARYPLFSIWRSFNFYIDDQTVFLGGSGSGVEVGVVTNSEGYLPKSIILQLGDLSRV